MVFHLIEDTRQKIGQHTLKNEYWHRSGAMVVRCRLPFGDYVKVPSIAVDTKADIYEIASNLENDHGRFRKECIEAERHGCQLVILVENNDGVRTLSDLEKWTETSEHFKARNGKRRYMGARLVKTMSTMSERYGVRFEFCTPNESPQRVLDILDE